MSMSDTAQKIAEIREALKNCTFPANERLIFVESEEDETTYEIVTERGVVIAKGLDPYDAYLFANAPEWLRFLLDELERLEQERNMYKASSEVFYERLKKAAEQRDKLIEGLRWYAQRNDLNTVSLMLSDKGQRARDILHEIGVTVE